MDASAAESELAVDEAVADDAEAMVGVIHAAFGARPALDPPSTAIDETPESIAARLAAGAGIFARLDGRPAGVILLQPIGPRRVSFQRVSVHPDFQRHGIASAMVTAAMDFAAERGFEEVELFARGEFADLILFWQHRGFAVERPEPLGVTLSRRLPTVLTVRSPSAMHDLGVRLAGLLRGGDLIIASGELGAGKTTLTQGIGEGLHAAGQVISPTFVLSRIHPSTGGRPDLVHVDAYRLSSAAELEDLDLDATLDRSVTVIEWGAGLAEGLTDSRLEIDIDRSPSAPDDHRTVVLRPVGARWREANFGVLTRSDSE